MLELKNVSLEIAGSSILSNVSFSVTRGEMVGVIGPNGSGKTSLFNCISGFLRPQVGSIFLGGNDIGSLSADQRARQGIGRVFQNFGVFREMTLLENLVTAIESREGKFAGLIPWGKAVKRRRDEALSLLATIKLAGRSNERAASLSGGQMRLLEITRTLAFGAEVILLDEPTAGVSPKMKDEVAEIIIKLRSLHKTVMVIEHDINFIEKFCGRILVLDIGRIVMDDSPDKVRADRRLQEIYFGS